MNADRLFDNIREEVRRIIPADHTVSAIEFEGPLVVIYTKEFEKFSSNANIVKMLAQGLRKRVAIRPDPSMLADSNEVEEKIRKMVPEEAEISDIFFEFETGEATIEALSPGLVIGKQGSLLNDLKKETGWNVKVVRAPPIPSKTVSDVR
ncbi:MAG: beta-CASP ribonuclease aCPSF1, partial [Methanomassiliicoccaceae archaeon]|nr:beta-CASP ribonuclease aCPSF1 [Methanomassiliicoccaceae archaeon]